MFAKFCAIGDRDAASERGLQPGQNMANHYKSFGGYDGKAVWVDPEEATVWVGEDVAVEVSMYSCSVKVINGTSWETWFPDAGYPDLPNLIVQMKRKFHSAPST
eukprot:9346030-Pyramimonas_sp.AAC.1